MKNDFEYRSYYYMNTDEAYPSKGSYMTSMTFMDESDHNNVGKKSPCSSMERPNVPSKTSIFENPWNIDNNMIIASCST
jgi:hypothetical protein